MDDTLATTSSSSASPRSSRMLLEDPTQAPTSVSPNPRPQQRERIPSFPHSRTSQYSHRTSRSRPHSNIYPAFASSLSYAFVRDFAYPVFHPMHYGAEAEPSGESTPSSEWNLARRSSDPMEQYNSGASGSTGGWSAGPWGGDGAMYGDLSRYDGEVENLPSTSFGSEHGNLDHGEDDSIFRRSSRHQKSKSYTNISDYERGRRRESGRGRDADAIPLFHGHQTDPAGRESLRMSRGYGSGIENGGQRRNSPFASTLPNRSFQNPQSHPSSSMRDTEIDPDEQIPLDAEPHATGSPVRDSLGPEDEDLFAGLSLALYSFEPENSNELRLIEGQEILVSYRHGQGWLVASDPRTGEQGLVPEAYVRLIADIPGYDPETGQFVDLEGELDENGEAIEHINDNEEDDGEEEESAHSLNHIQEHHGDNNNSAVETDTPATTNTVADPTQQQPTTNPRLSKKDLSSTDPPPVQ